MLASEIETRMSMTDDAEWDAPGGIVGSLLLYRPTIENNSGTVSIVADSNDANRQMGRVACTAGQGFQGTYFFEYPGGGTGSDGVFDNQPEECWISFEMEFNNTISAGASNWLEFLRLGDTSGDQILLRQRGGTNFLQWLNYNPGGGAGSILTATHRHTTDLAETVRYEVRIHWDSENDTITLSVLNLDAGTLLIDEETVSTIASGIGKLRSITLGCLTSGIAQNYDFRKIIINPVEAPGEMDSTSTWWPETDHKPPYSAAQKTDNGAGDVDVNLVYLFNPGIMGAGDTWKFQYRQGTSGGWTDIAAVTANSAGFMQDVLENLTPGTTYQARLSNSGGTVTTRPCTFVTQTASDGAAGTLKYTFNSCLSQRTHPHRSLYYAAQQGTHHHLVIEDMGYHNTIGDWNTGAEWVALGTKAARQTAWIKMTKMELLNTYWEYIGSEKGLVIGLGDHLFRNDLAGGLAKYGSGDDKTMLDDIKEVVELTIVPFRFFDGTSASGDYWTTWETANTAFVWFSTRMAADCGEGRSPALYGGQASTWDGQVGGEGGLVLSDGDNWGTTLLGSTQLAGVRSFLQATEKQRVVFICPSLPFSGGMREYQDMATYAEFCQMLADVRDNADVEELTMIVGDLHNEQVVLGKNILSSAALSRLGYGSDILSKVDVGVLAGGGLRDPHNLRAQIGNDIDNDGGLRGGTWNGASNPRWAHARDTNDAYIGPAASWDLDDSNPNFADAGYGDHGGNFACFGVLEIDEAARSVAVSTYDGHDGGSTYSGSFAPSIAQVRGAMFAKASAKLSREGKTPEEALRELGGD